MMLTYQEPQFIRTAEQIYEKFAKARQGKKQKGNIVSLLSDAMKQLRQMGPAGLKLWIEIDDSRKFITRGMTAAGFSFNLEADDFDEAWVQIERIMRVLCMAKYYAKTRG